MNAQEYLHMYHEEERHWWYVGMRSIALSVLPAFSVPRQSRILDVGCGTGYNLGWLRDHYQAGVAGVDCCSIALSFCLKRGEQQLVQGNVAVLPFKSAAFDLVTAFDMLSEIRDKASRSHALKELLRVLRPGGRVLIRVAACKWLRSGHDVEVSTNHRFGRRELYDLLGGAGFEVVRLTYANTLLFPAASLWRLMKRAGIAPGGSDVRSSTRGPSGINSLLLSLLKLEAAILKNPRTRFWIGLSLVALARKGLS
jgi:SAM-dependent methyltransferase